MKRIAIVGNIASGKSQIEKILMSNGYKVADTDKINHVILASDYSVINEIKEAFKGFDIIDENGNLSREKIGKIVFSIGEKRLILEKILHKRISEKVEDFFKENINEKLVFISIPLLFETKQEDNYDKIIFISADEDIRLKRLMKRNNYSESYAKTRIKSQLGEKEKIEKSDFIIFNNSDFISLERQILDILKKLND